MVLERIHADLISAMKSGDATRRDILRFLESDCKKKAIDARKEALTDEEALKLIASHIKSRRDSAVQFRAGGREDLAIPEEAAILVLEAYLPEQMSDEALEAMIRSFLAESGIIESKDMGPAIGAVMKQVSGKADGTRVREMMEKCLKQ